jgi:hypothetical protein
VRRPALPVIIDDAQLLKQRLPHAHARRKTPRRPKGDRLASGHAQTRQAGAQRLGVPCHPVGHGRVTYEARGPAALLVLYVPADTLPSLSPAALAAIEQVLRQPAGFASYATLRPWVPQTSQLDLHYHTLYTIVRTTFKTELTGARPDPTKPL